MSQRVRSIGKAARLMVEAAPRCAGSQDPGTVHHVCDFVFIFVIHSLRHSASLLLIFTSGLYTAPNLACVCVRTNQHT